MIDASSLAALGDLNSPGRYLHWSIFTVSEANLVLIAVMVVIFGAALVIPFPGHDRKAQGAPDVGTDDHAPAPLPAPNDPPSTLGTRPMPPCGRPGSGAGR